MMVAAENTDDGTARALDALNSLRGNPRDVSPEAVEEALRVLPSYYRGRETEVEVQGVRGAPDWFAYEMRIWEFSELVREYLRANRGMRGKCGVLDEIADVIRDARFGKGRQNFVLVLAQYGGAQYAEVIGDRLTDPDLLGHAVKALAKLRVPGYSSQIESVLKDSKVGWIRSAARKYLQALGRQA